MSITDRLKQEGYKPEANQDGEWQVLKGQYKCRWATLRPETMEDGSEYIQAEWFVTEVLEGSQVNLDSKYPQFKRRYYLDNEDSMKKLCNDAFTVGVNLDLSSDQAFYQSFDQVIGQETFIRGWGWTPEKDPHGNTIPEGERKTIQQFVIKQPKNVKISKEAAAGTAPF